MGLGFALMEEVVVEEGTIVNPRFSSYLIPTTKDAPDIISLIVEEQEESGPFVAKGVGEPPLIPTAPAILNAVSNALGVRITAMPLTPEKILAALEKKEEEDQLKSNGEGFNV